MDKIALELLKKSACGPHLKRIGFYPHQGVIIMLSSLHSKSSCGIGEFLDLIPLFEWSKKIGLDFIQLLPITDSGFDNSPYNPISTLALNPVYLSLHALPYLKQDKELLLHQQKLQKLTQTKKVQYSKVREKKFKFLREYLSKYQSKLEKNEKYQKFLKENSWLYDYALFNTFSDHYHTEDWTSWPKPIQKLSATQKKEKIKKHKTEVDFYLKLQFLCFEQFKLVKREAQKHKIYMFGDLPFLVSSNSCDAWSFPKIFMMEYSVGSPPDKLTPEGQNWNFPAYNWAELKRSDFAWWKLRLKIAEKFFHIYRLDHIIGFYRTWNIPRGKEGKDGSFSPKDPSVWLEHGRTFLKALLSFSKMLPIGEDLVIPQAIIDSMQHLGICGTRILTWQRTGSGGLDFVPFPLYTVASITNIASHDTTTLAQWWKKYPKTAEEFSLWKGWKYTPSLDYKKRLELLYDSHHTSSLFHANLLQEYCALFKELVHPSIHEERINYPGTPSFNNWRYRFIPSVEELIKHRKLTDALKKIMA